MCNKNITPTIFAQELGVRELYEQRRMKVLEELKPYLDEIRETDKRFRNKEIKLSGFEW